MGGYKVVVPPFTVDKKSADDDKDEPKIPLKKVEQFFYDVCSAAELQEFDNLKNCSDTIVYSGTGVVHPELLKLLSRYMEVVIVNPEANTTFSVGLCRADDSGALELRIEKLHLLASKEQLMSFIYVATINLSTGVIKQKLTFPNQPTDLPSSYTSGKLTGPEDFLDLLSTIEGMIKTGGVEESNYKKASLN